MKISQEKGGSKNKLRYDVIYEINIMLLEIKNMSYKKALTAESFSRFL